MWLIYFAFYNLEKASLEPEVIMNMWNVIFAGLLLVTLGSALEDAGVYVNGTFSQGRFQKRILPATTMICTSRDNAFEWWRINSWELVLQDFERGNNNQNATLRLGTPGLHLLSIAAVEFHSYQYCRYLPKAYHNYTMRGPNTFKMVQKVPIEYYAVKVKNAGRATIKQGWNYLTTLVKNQFPGISPQKLYLMFVELTATGDVYVGAIQNKR